MVNITVATSVLVYPAINLCIYTKVENYYLKAGHIGSIKVNEMLIFKKINSRELKND